MNKRLIEKTEPDNQRSRPLLIFVTIILATAFVIASVELLLWFLNLPDQLQENPADFTKSLPGLADHFIQENGNPKIPYSSAPNSVKASIYPSNPRGYFTDVDSSLGDVRCLIEHRNNIHGFRGMDYPMEKPPNTRRIIFLGDSYTYGQGVRLEHIWPELVCQALSAEGTPTLAINTAVNGHATEAQVETFVTLGLNFEPDFVILEYNLNDAGTDAEFFRLLDGARAEYQSGWLNHSRFLGLATWVLKRQRDSTRYLRMTQESYEPPGSEGWNLAQESLLRLRDECRSRNLPLLVTIWPFLYRLSGDYPFNEAHATIENFCESSEIPVLDLLPSFTGRNEEDLWVHFSDQHPNEIANAIAAEALLDSIRNELNWYEGF